MATMISTSQPSNAPTFVVRPQPILKDTPPERGQKINFKQPKIRIQPAASIQKLSDVTTQPKVYSQKIRFADPKTQTRFTPRQRPAEERPFKRPKLEKVAQGHGERSFSTRRPLKVQLPTDAWQLIFQRCELSFLLKARLVCRAFRDLLDREALWREARIGQFGDAIPERPLAITEFQYAKLLVGRGCQIAPCPRRDTRKVYWPFMLRMCEKCFNRIVEVPSLDWPEARSYSEMYRALESQVRQTIPSQLPSLLSAARLRGGRWAGPRLLDSEHPKWQQSSAAENSVVLTADYEALRLGFNEKVQDDPDHFVLWATQKWEKTWEQMNTALILSEMDLAEPSRQDSLREERTSLFAEKALDLSPPMAFEVLEKFAAYHKALETPNPATIRSWETLKAKIDVPELRAQAEQLVRWEEEALEWSKIGGDDTHQNVQRHRQKSRYHRNFDEYAPEQRVVMEIASEELESLLDVVHDYDVLLKWLNRVQRAYESLHEKPEGLNGDGTRGPYKLMLDDVLMILQGILEPMLTNADDDSSQYKRVLKSLRCMGCAGANKATTYDFRHLVEHVRKTHAQYVAKGSFWYRLAIPSKSSGRDRNEVSWYRLPWFKTMPALPFHHKATTSIIWDPDVETEYIQHEEGARSPPVSFDEPVTYQTRVPGDDFTANFCRAVRTLDPTRLESPYVIKIAFEYAKRRFKTRSSTVIPARITTIQQLQSLETICARFTSRLEFKFPCRQCLEQRERSKHRRRPPRPQSLSALTTHWQSKHGMDDEICVTELIILPAEEDLMETMEREDAKLEAEKACILKKITRSIEAPDPRAAALLETPSIRSRFDKLFVPRTGGCTAFCVGRVEELETSSPTTRASTSSDDTQWAHFIPESEE